MMLSMGLTTATAGALADTWTNPPLTVGPVQRNRSRGNGADRTTLDRTVHNGEPEAH
jgi:hypothetical protein